MIESWKCKLGEKGIDFKKPVKKCKSLNKSFPSKLSSILYVPFTGINSNFLFRGEIRVKGKCFPGKGTAVSIHSRNE